MAAVKTIHDGPTTIVFCDDYCYTTEEEVQAALQRIARLTLPHMRKVEMKKKQEETG